MSMLSASSRPSHYLWNKSKKESPNDLRPERKRTSPELMKSGNPSRPRASSSKTNQTAPAAGSADQPELLYGLHAVREALRAGTRPLQRVLVLRTDRQFS